MSDADDVLRHSEDEGEWEDEPVEIERRPTGTVVLSARIPRVLADQVFAVATGLAMKPSEVVRLALEHFVNPQPQRVLSVYPGYRVSFFRVSQPFVAINPVVTLSDLRIA